MSSLLTSPVRNLLPLCTTTYSQTVCCNLGNTLDVTTWCPERPDVDTTGSPLVIEVEDTQDSKPKDGPR